MRSSNDRPRRPLRLLAGAVLVSGVFALVAVLLAAIASSTTGSPGTGGVPIDMGHLLRMTIIQASLTTILSLVGGTLIAWALNRLRFPGRDLVVALFACAIVTPGLVVAFGLLGVWGRVGWVNQLALAVSGRPLELPIFGLGGVIAAHVILDASFAARLLVSRLDALPAAKLKTGQSLGLSALQRFVLIDWPVLRPSLPGIGAIIFLLAFTSFPIVLMLGGGPANQTLEVAIYSAVRLDFDLAGAVRLALVQIAVCALVILGAAAFAPVTTRIDPSRPARWPDRGLAHVVQVAVLGLGIAGFGLPLLAVLLDGIGPGMPALLTRPSFQRGLATSLAIATGSALLTLLLAVVLGVARGAAEHRWQRIVLALPANVYLAVPAVVLALGFFLVVRNAGIAPSLAAPVIVVLANALLSLPFAVATLAPPLEIIPRDRGKLIRALNLGGWRQFAAVEWPLIGREAGVVLALGFCFSLGDLGVIALFGTEDFATLPLLMYRALGAYRSNDAAAIASVMLVLAVAAFFLLPPLLARLTDARR